MKAGALRTILAHGVWTPRRAHNIYKTVMETVFYVEKRTQESITCGENAKRSTNVQISDMSNSCRSDIKRNINLNASGTLEPSHRI
eukprot:12661998-Heterocapsa_arctica.AAC.1